MVYIKHQLLPACAVGEQHQGNINKGKTDILRVHKLGQDKRCAQD